MSRKIDNSHNTDPLLNEEAPTETTPMIIRDADNKSPTPGSVQTYPDEETQSKIWIVCAVAVALNGVFGMINLLFGYTIEDIADNLGLETSQVGSILVARFVGILLGMTARIQMEWLLKGTKTFMILQVVQAVALVIAPYCTASIWQFYAIFFFLGLSYGVFQVSSATYIRTLQDTAFVGHWMTYYLLTFCTAGVGLAFIQLTSITFAQEYMLVAGIVMVMFFVLLFTPNPATDLDLIKNVKTSLSAHDVPHYWVDIVCASMLALNIGAKETVIYFIDSYVDDCADVTISAADVYLILVSSLAIGYWVFAYCQRYITQEQLMLWTFVSFIIQVLPLFVITTFPSHTVLFVTSVCIYGFISPPSISLCFTVCYQYTYRSILSTTIMLVGLTVGALILPYLVTLIWESNNTDVTLFYMAELYTFIAIILLPLAPFFTYIEEKSFSFNFSRPSKKVEN